MPGMLRRGDRGDGVVAVQEFLWTHGVDPGPVDGIFGPLTDQAVRAFQARRLIGVDGIVGPMTWSRLFQPGTRTPPVPPAGDGSVCGSGRPDWDPVAAHSLWHRVNVLMQSLNVGVWINSYCRSQAQQERLWDRYQQCKARGGRHCTSAARPGTSKHEVGLAADLGFSDGSKREAAHRRAEWYGLCFPIPSERWHAEGV